MNSLHSVAQQLPLETFTPANGLVDARINKMYQDQMGRLFFLTQEGFTIYDGQRMENYNTVNGIDAQLSNDVLELNGQVFIYNFNGVAFRIGNGTVTADSSNQKRLVELSQIISVGKNDWLIATNSALYRKTEGKLQQLAVNTGDSKKINIEGTAIAKKKLLFFRWAIEDGNKLYLYDYEKQQLQDVMKDHQAFYLRNDHHQNIFFYDGIHWQQLDSSAIQNGKLQAAPAWFEKLVPQGFKNGLLSFDNSDNAWLLKSDKGACMINRQTSELTFYLQSQGLLEGVSDVFQDREKNYWFIASGRGVQKLQQSALSNISHLGDIPVDYATVISPTEEGNCFLNTLTGNFVNDKKIGEPTKDLKYIFYWQNQCWAFSKYKTLVSNVGNKIAFSDKGAGSPYDNFQHSENINFDKNGRLVLSGNILIAIDKNYKVSALPLPYYSDNTVVDTANSYWCFSRDKYVRKFNWHNGELRLEFSQFLPNANPRFAVLWNDSTFFVGNRNEGIMIFTMQANGVKYVGDISKRNGLSSNFIYTMLKQNDHELMVSTATGLAMIKIIGKDTVVEQVSARNNYFAPFENLVLDKNNIIWCRGFNGQLFEYQENISDTAEYRPVADLRSITVNGKLIDHLNIHDFSFRENNFLFTAIAPSFIDNRNIRFTFLLSSNTGDFDQRGTKADFEINNLSPGDYRLNVTVSYPGKIYPDAVVTYSFSISKPFWKTWWFILLLALVGIVAVILLVRSFYQRQLKKQKNVLEKKQAVEKERTRIATDMHDDFGANLSRIKFLSEKMQLNKQNDVTLNTDLHKISRYSDEMSEKMGEIVWALNQRYDSLEDLISFSRSYASEYLDDKNISLDFVATNYNDQNIHGELRRNIFLIIKEALHNIVKHAAATSVRISFEEKNRELIVIIQDNGKGFEAANIRPFANGLENMKKRMQTIGGAIAIEGSNGTNITITVMI